MSTDLHRFSEGIWAIDMPTTMSTVLHIGMSLEDVILKSTWAPGKAIDCDNELGTLKKGSVAGPLVFDLVDGEFCFEDTHLHTERATRKLKPFLVLEKGSFLSQAVIRFSSVSYMDLTLGSCVLLKRQSCKTPNYDQKYLSQTQ